ncbi:hypothetical protein F5887DRAFT_979215 [Amanita rubescens]|nr:hypothetical protein F5887DRAFT_979215 [Amanita rubescens]
MKAFKYVLPFLFDGAMDTDDTRSASFHTLMRPITRSLDRLFGAYTTMIIVGLSAYNVHSHSGILGLASMIGSTMPPAGTLHFSDLLFFFRFESFCNFESHINCFTIYHMRTARFGYHFIAVPVSVRLGVVLKRRRRRQGRLENMREAGGISPATFIPLLASLHAACTRARVLKR